MRTVTVVMTYMLGASSLASLALAGCSKDPAGGTVDPGREAVILSIAEANYGVSGGVRRSGTSAANGGAPQTRAIVGGNGSTFFTDRDCLGLFLRGDGYEDVDNRIVQLDYPGEGPQKKWNITGEAIPLYADAATVTAYFPYSDVFGLTMSAIPLSSGPYDVNSNDVVWQRDTVHAAHTQAMFLEMQHAMTRVKIRLSGGAPDSGDPDPDVYPGEGRISLVRIADAGDVASEDRVVYLDGTLDLTQATPVVTPGWPDAVADKSEKTLTAEGVLYDLLLLPVDKIDAGKVLLEVELDGKVLSVPFPVDAVDKWEAGKAYTYEVSVRNGGAQVVFGKATVTPWNYGGSISGDLDTSKPEYGGGDVQDWGDNEWESGASDDPVYAEVTPQGDIPGLGGTYIVRFEEGYATEGMKVRARSGDTSLAEVTITDPKNIQLKVPAYPNSEKTTRDVIFEFYHNDAWVQIGYKRTQDYTLIGTDYKGATIYWVNPENEDDFRAIAPTERVVSGCTFSGEVLSPNEFNGKAYCDRVVDQCRSGAMNTVVGAIVWCYDMTVDDDPPGTYYLPSFAELVVFNDNLVTLKEVRPDLIASLKAPSCWYYSVNKCNVDARAWYGAYLNGHQDDHGNGRNAWGARCVRQKD